MKVLTQPKDFYELFSEGEYLFRYRSITPDNLDAFKSNRLYFSTAEHFNDPYDNRMYVNVNEILREVYDNLDMGMDSYLEKWKFKNPVVYMTAHKIWNGEERDELLAIISKNIEEAVTKIKTSIRENVKTICFSKRFDSILMWSHYAANHKGYLLMYDLNDLQNVKRFSEDGEELSERVIVKEVNYVKSPIDMTNAVGEYVRFEKLENMGDVEPPDGKISKYLLRDFITQKALEWGYEEEWRMIPRIINLEEPSRLNYIECVPKAIIFGADCSVDDAMPFAKYAVENGISIYKAYIDDYRPDFGLEIGIVTAMNDEKEEI